MSERFKDLKKIRSEPAARMLSTAGLKLKYKLKSPGSADVPTVLAELAEAGEIFDMITMMAVALPKREATWWACLAARDMLEPDAQIPRPLAAAEAWVFKPSDENRETVRKMMEGGDPDDDTVLCATAAYYAEGSLGTGDLAEHDAPPAAVAACVMAMNLKCLDLHSDQLQVYGDYLIDRGLDIARGGSGRIDPPPPATDDAQPVTEGET